MTDVVLVLTTVSSEDEGEKIARALVGEGLAACVNVLGPMTSIYRWKEQVERETERQVVIKTTRARLPGVQVRIGELHSYELPELLVLPVVDGSPGYLDWVSQETRRT
jgi:periplasmic divalent cation tolerance protein